MAVCFHIFRKGLQGSFCIRNNRNVADYIFIYFRRVNVNVDHFGLFGIAFQIARNTIVETHPNGNQHIAFVGFDIRTVIAVHAEVSNIERMIDGHGR